MQRWWVRTAVLIFIFLTSLWFMLWVIGQQNEPELAKINRQLEVLNKITPEQHYNKTKEELIRQKIFYEKRIKSYSLGTGPVFYRELIGMPEAIRQIPTIWKEFKKYKEKE